MFTHMYWHLAKYGTQRDDCYKHICIANGLINHVVRVLEAHDHLGALELICSRVPNYGIRCFGLMSGVHLFGLLSIISFYQH